MKLASFLGLILLYASAQIATFVFKKTDNEFYNYFHFTGGVLVGLFMYSFTNNYLTAFLLTIVIGLLWEVHEWILWKFFYHQKKFKQEKDDTINDLVLDGVGALVALVVLSFI